MNFSLSIHGEGGYIAYEIASDLRRANAVIINSGHCICSYRLSKVELANPSVAKAVLEDIDVLIYHPAHDTINNYRYCWDVHKTVIEANPDKRFYVFAKFSPEIEDFLGGERANLKFFRDDGHLGEVWDEVVGLARKGS